MREKYVRFIRPMGSEETVKETVFLTKVKTGYKISGFYLSSQYFGTEVDARDFLKHYGYEKVEEA